MEENIYIGQAAKLLNRREATIRGWERDALLPTELQSQRDEKGWRYWTRTQIDAIQDWIYREDRRPGKGLPHYKPSREKIESHIAKTRGPRINNDLSRNSN